MSIAWEAWVAVVPFALFFGALAVITKGKEVARDAKRGWPEWRTNILTFTFDTVFVLGLVAVPSAWLAQQFGSPETLLALWAKLPVWFVCFVAVVAGDYIGYWRHRLEHSPFLWPAHAMHHSDREMNWFSLNRMHPLNRLTTVTIDTTLLALAGFPWWALVANGVVRNAWGYFIHADIPWNLGPVGTALISPSAHRWHHVLREDLAGKNFATVFTFWDRMHGTYQPSPVPCREATGVENHQGGFLFEMLHPFVVLNRVAKLRTSAASAGVRVLFRPKIRPTQEGGE